MRSWFLKITGPETVNRKILRAAFLVGLLTLLAKCAATVKELMVARWFGRSDALDAFLIAFLLPSSLLGIVMGALGSSLIPSFVAIRQEHGTAAAQRLFSSVLVLALIALIAGALLLGLLAPYYLPLLGSGFSPAKLRLTRMLLYALLPFVLFNGVASCVSAVLNAGERFALPALTPLLTPLATIVFIQFAAVPWGAFSIVAGVVVASFLEASLLVWSLRFQGLRFSLKWMGLDPPLRRVLRQYPPLLAAAFVSGGVGMIDQAMAAMLAPGSVAALNYGNRVISVVVALGASSLGTAVLPYFSKMVAENDWRGCRHTLKRYSLLLVSTTVPLTAILVIFSKPLVRLLFQRGSFTAVDTELVSWIQLCYALQIPFSIWLMLFVRFLSAARRNHVLLYSAVINLILDVVLNLALMRVWGVAGIALSTSLFFVVSLVFLGLYSIRLLAREISALSASVAAQHATR